MTFMQYALLADAIRDCLCAGGAAIGGPITQAFIVALFSGVIATVLFFGSDKSG